MVTVMDTTATFLHGILPSTGLKCIAVFQGERPRHFFFPTVHEAAAFALQQDAAGHTVYFACASYREKRRKGDSVEAISCLWADVDVGTDKAYKTPDAAIAALIKFCADSKMPPPAVNNSGSGGLHLFWPL